VLKANSVPNLANKSLQNLEVNFASLFDTIFFKTLYSLTTSLMNTYATSLAENIDFTGMKATFGNFSTMTMMDSCRFTVFGKPAMKFMEITFHFNFVIVIGCSSPPGCLHFAFNR